MKSFSMKQLFQNKNNGEKVNDELIRDDCQSIILHVPQNYKNNKQSWWLSQEECERLIDDSFFNIPQEYSSKLDNVSFYVLDEVPEKYKDRIPSNGELLGLYVGVPLTMRNSSYGILNTPDQIFVFTSPIQRVSSNQDMVKEQLHKTLLHEIGHYFGITDRRLRELGY